MSHTPGVCAHTPAHMERHARTDQLRSELLALLTISHSDCIIHRWAGEEIPLFQLSHSAMSERSRAGQWIMVK